MPVGRSFIETMERVYSRQLTSRHLSDLPVRPRFVFNATDLGFVVNWVFERDRVGSYRAGYLDPAVGAQWVVVEKLQAMVALGIANSRMKDYYDVW